MTMQAHRYHDISVGHRVFQHESKCAHLHGHNYRIHFTVEAPALDKVGRVMDFSEVKARIGKWLDTHWDHGFITAAADEEARNAVKSVNNQKHYMLEDNPTAENIARHLLEQVGPQQLAGTGVRLTRVVVEETRKCSASASE